MDTQQLLDSLTAHMALYHRRRPLPSLDRNPNPRKAILRWFSDLSVDQRRSFLTVVDPDFVKILIQMQMRMRDQGHGFFFILTDVPSSTDQSLPTLCFRRSRGLLSRYCESNSQERSIRDGLLLFGSKEGVKNEECSLDSVTVSKDLVSDVDKFVDVMDSVSDGAFLHGEVDGLGSKWCELEWLKEKGYYTLEAFVASKMELALRLAWLSLRGGKNKKVGKLREKAASSVIVANVFWRKKSCSDWFLGLDPGIRKEMVVTFLSKGAKYLEKEIFKSPGLLKDGIHYIKVGSSFCRNYSCDGSYGKPIQLHFATDIDLPVFVVNGVSSIRGSRLYTRLVELFVLQKITSMLNTYANNDSGAECLLYSTLDSVQTIFDHALRRFRGFLTVVARDSIEHELLMKNLNTNHPSVKKLDDKHALDTRCKSRRQNSKKANSRLEALKADSTLKDSVMDRNSKSGSKIGKHAEKGVKEHKISTAASTLEHTTSENRVSVSRKKSKRNGVVCKRSSLKESTKVEMSIAVKAETLISPLLDQNDAAENTPLFDDATLSDIGTQDNLPWQFGKDALQKESCSNSGKEACKGNMVDNKDCQNCEQFENEDPGKDSQIMYSFCTKTKSSVHDAAAKSSSNNHLEDVDSSLVQKVGPVSCDGNSSVKKVFDDISLRSESSCTLQPISTENMYKEASPNEVLNDCRSFSDYGTHCPHSPTIPVGGKSYEWPSLNPVQFSHLNSNHPPAATDRYHLDVTNNWPGHFHQSYYSGRHQLRTSCTERVCSHMVPCLTPPVSLDWPPMVRSGRLSQSGTLSYDAVYNTRLQSSLCTGISNQNMQLGGSSSDSERKFSGDGVCLPDRKKTFDYVEDNDSNWMSEEEYDIHTTNGRDYSKFFGGGIMYWNPSDPVGTSFSRAPSHSSEDSSWAWYEADLNRAIDDMIDMSGFPPYSGNGLASPTGGTFCSPLDGLGSGSQSLGHGYVISATEVKKTLDPQCSVAEVLEEKISGNKTTSPGPLEGVKGDSLPYPILRPIVIPSSSRKGSRSEFKYSHDHVSPCLSSSSSRRDQPGIKRPPSPVVLCVPRSPRVPPPSPVGESRKHRGFPVVRSGSSSPRNWGLRNWHREETNSSSSQFFKDGPEVVWAPWENKGISSNSLMQPITGSLLQDRLIAITQIARDQDHPDVMFPLQPPETANCSSRKSSLSLMHCLLQEEINSFCQKVASENQLKKPYINWAVKRVAKSLQVLWPRSRTSIFGSNVTGLALPTSDVDLVVCLPPVRNLEPIKEAGILEGRNGIKETCLQHAARYLANQEWVKNDSLKTIENTTIPLIMLVAVVPSDIISSGTTSAIEALELMPAIISGEPVKIPQCGPSLENVPSSCSSNSGAIDAKAVSLDISFKSAAHTGLQTTNLVRELTDQFPASVPLALVLKQFLADRSLDRAYSGGLSSYCLVLLITRFLQHEHHVGRSLNQNLGSLLMDFLYFFGNVFDPRRMRVSILGSGFYMNRERGHSIDPIHIDDPLCPTNNVGRNCFRIHQCIKAFADAYSILERELPLFSGESDPCAHASVKLLPKIIPSITIHGQDSTENKD